MQAGAAWAGFAAQEAGEAAVVFGEGRRSEDCGAVKDVLGFVVDLFVGEEEGDGVAGCEVVP